MRESELLKVGTLALGHPVGVFLVEISAISLISAMPAPLAECRKKLVRPPRIPVPPVALSTGMAKKVDPRFCEYEEEKLRSAA